MAIGGASFCQNRSLTPRSEYDWWRTLLLFLKDCLKTKSKSEFVSHLNTEIHCSSRTLDHLVLWLQVLVSLRMYNTLVERCFTDCVDTFRRKTLDKQEETCVKRCAEKFLKHSMRVGLRFAELNQGAATPD